MNILKWIGVVDVVLGLVALVLIPVLHHHHVRLLIACLPFVAWFLLTFVGFGLLLWLLSMADFG